MLASRCASNRRRGGPVAEFLGGWLVSGLVITLLGVVREAGQRRSLPKVQGPP